MAKLQPVVRGNVRNIYDLDDMLILETTDRVSAFDVNMRNEVPKKGIVLNLLSDFWCRYVETAHIVDTHRISVNNDDMPEEFQAPEYAGRCMLVKKLRMIPIEFIVRGYITGSCWKSYQKDQSICCIQIRPGMQESQQFTSPLLTPATKTRSGVQKQNVTFNDLVNMVGFTLAMQLREASLRIYYLAAQYAKGVGILIADTKFEFGLDEKGTLVLADEVLTPDCSRFWLADTYEVGRPQICFDKQYLCDWLNASGWDMQPPAPELPQDVINTTSAKYVEAYERLTNNRFPF